MTVLELFAGAGGAALGLHRAGLTSLACVEHNADACATLLAAGFPAILADVRDHAAWMPALRAPVDVLWASPPCQAFSSAGRRKGALDDRDGWPWTIDAIDALRAAGLGPGRVVCENVPGLTHHRGACPYKHIDGPVPEEAVVHRERLAPRLDDDGAPMVDEDGEPVMVLDIGADGKPVIDRVDPVTGCPGCYWLRWILPAFRARFASVETRVLDAYQHGVPQKRRRVFLVAGPSAAGWNWPEPTHADPRCAACGAAGSLPAALFGRLACRACDGTGVAEPVRTGRLMPWVTVRTALGLGSLMERQNGARGLVATDTDGPSPAVLAGSHRDNGPRTRDGAGRGDLPDHDLDEPAPAIGANQGTGGRAGVMAVTGPRVDPERLLDPGRHGGATDRVSLAGTRPELLDTPSVAVTTCESKGTRGDHMRGGMDRASDHVYLAAGIRRLTVEECAALFAMPTDYPWRGTKTERYRQVGNMVAPDVAEALGRALLAADGDPG